MFRQRCVACANSTNVERFDRLSSVVEYFRCKACRHVWAIYKHDPSIIDHFGPVNKEPESRLLSSWSHPPHRTPHTAGGQCWCERRDTSAV